MPPLEGFDDIDIPRRGPGQPPKVLDLDVIERAASIGCSKEEIAAVLGVVKQTLYNHAATNPEIDEAIERGRDKGKATLRRMQWQGAKDGNPTMLIWLGKQLLGQRDKQEFSGEGGGPLVVQVVKFGDNPAS